MVFNSENRALYSRLLILGGLIYVTWSLLISFFIKYDYNDVYARLLVSIPAVLIGIFHQKLGRYFLLAVHITLTLFMVQFAFFLGYTGHERYMFGSLVLALGIFIGFLNYPREFLIHAIVSIASFVGFLFYFGTFEKSFPSVRQIFMLYGVMYIISRVSRKHSNTIERLRAERLKLLNERSEMITENLKNAQSVFTALTSALSDLPKSIQLKSFYKPANEAGGDWIGHFYIKEKNWLILTIGDVTGHDLASSLVTIAVAGAARGTFECLSHSATDLKSLVQQMTLSSHLAVKHCGIQEKSMTAAFLGLDLETFQGVYINCAHPSGILHTQKNIIPLTSTRSQFLGDEDFKAHVTTLDFSSMKSILLYTDGLIETNDLPISEAKLTRWMMQSKDFYSEVTEAFKDVKLQDDVSFLFIERELKP